MLDLDREDKSDRVRIQTRDCAIFIRETVHLGMGRERVIGDIEIYE